MPTDVSNLTVEQVCTADAIKTARDKSGLSHAEFAARVKVHRTTVLDWEAGRRCPPLWRVHDIAVALRISSQTLVKEISKLIEEYRK